MNRITSLVLLLFFLAGNSYASINIHYCGGEFQSISFVTKSKSCGKCGKESSSKKCCKDVQKILKADDFSKVKTHYPFQILTSSFLPSYFTFHPTFTFPIFQVLSSFFDNPPKLRTPIFIRFHSLII